MKKRGKLIVIDGTDGSGKATQAKLLVERLRKVGKRVQALDFPQYEKNFFGRFIGECQAGKHGDFVHLDPYIASALYAADRYESKALLEKWLNEGAIVVLDRYASSNQIHQGGKISDGQKRKKFLHWIEEVEFHVFGLPKPDAIVYLDVPVKESQRLLKNKGQRKKKRYLRRGDKDVVERDPQYLEASRKSALGIVRNKNHWLPITCMENGKLLSRQIIAERVWQNVQPSLQ